MNANSTVIKNFMKREFPEELDMYRDGDKSYRINSPFIDDSKRHLYIFADTGQFRCMKSGENGDIVKLVKAIKKFNTYADAQEFIMGNYYKLSIADLKKRVRTISDGNPKVKKRELNEIEMPTGFFKLDKKTEHNEKFFRYLYSRGFNKHIISKFGIHYCLSGIYSNRIIIPIYNDKKLVYFLARDITERSSKKYLNPTREEVSNNGTGLIVYNYDNISEGDNVVITEGALNAMIGCDNTNVIVSILGKSVLINQLEKILSKNPNSIILAYDNDKYFQKSTLDSIGFIKRIREDIEVRVINWESYIESYGEVCDFGDIIKKGIREIKIDSMKSMKYIKSSLI